MLSQAGAHLEVDFLGGRLHLVHIADAVSSLSTDNPEWPFVAGPPISPAAAAGLESGRDQ